MEPEAKTVLLIDDEEDTVRTFSRFLERSGYAVDSARDGHEAEDRMKERVYDVVVFDYKLPDVLGTELLKRANELQPGTVKVMLTGFPSMESAVDSLNLGADSYLLKPVDMKNLLEVIEEKLRERDESERVTEEKVAQWIEYRVKKGTR